MNDKCDSVTAPKIKKKRKICTKADKAANAQRLRDERAKIAAENTNSTINRFLRGEFAR